MVILNMIIKSYELQIETINFGIGNMEFIFLGNVTGYIIQ